MSDSEETRSCSKPQRAEEHGESYHHPSSNIPENNYWDHRRETSTNTPQTSVNNNKNNNNSYTAVYRNQTPVEVKLSPSTATKATANGMSAATSSLTSAGLNGSSNNAPAMLNSGEETDRPKRVSICLPNDESHHEAGATLVPLVVPLTASENNADSRYGDALISGTNDFTG